MKKEKSITVLLIEHECIDIPAGILLAGMVQKRDGCTNLQAVYEIKAIRPYLFRRMGHYNELPTKPKSPKKPKSPADTILNSWPEWKRKSILSIFNLTEEPPKDSPQRVEFENKVKHIHRATNEDYQDALSELVTYAEYLYEMYHEQPNKKDKLLVSKVGIAHYKTLADKILPFLKEDDNNNE